MNSAGVGGFGVGRVDLGSIGVGNVGAGRGILGSVGVVSSGVDCIGGGSVRNDNDGVFPNVGRVDVVCDVADIDCVGNTFG